MGGQRVLHPFEGLDDQGARAHLPVDQHDGARSRCLPTWADLAALGHDLREVCAIEGNVAFARRLHGAQPIAAGRQVGGQGLRRARIKRHLDAHMRRRCRAEQAKLAVQHLAHRRGRVKRELDVAGEVAAIGDIARSAVGVRRQLIEGIDDELGTAAARAQKIPAQLKQAFADRLQAHLDGMAFGHVPMMGERNRPDTEQVELLAA